MIGKTLGIYLARDFLRNVLFVFILFFFLIVVVDLIELSRDLGKVTDAQFWDIFKIAIFRAPSFAENIVPFAVLFGAATSLLLLNRRLELVVARASGVSVWQFLMPIALVAALLGAITSFGYNPLSLIGQAASRAVEAEVFGKVKGGFSNKSKNFWIRLGQKEGDVVIRARVEENGGTKLTAVSAYRFDPEGANTLRLDAATAEFIDYEGGSAYLLRDVTVTKPGEIGETVEEAIVPVNITRAQLQQDLTDPSTISFWRLGARSQRASESGKNALPFDTRYQSLLAQPLLFVAMVLLAATVSLTFARFGVSGKVILGGVLAGFVLYVLTKLVITFGSNGLVAPFIAAWSPAVVATLIGVTVLLYQEDG